MPLVKLERQDPVLRIGAPGADAPAQAARRSKIWELADTLHCSIIGTCLPTAELRHVLVRLDVTGAETADEHELHVLGVMLAARRDAGAKLVQRALDRRHGLAIKQYSRAKDEAALFRAWDESMRSGDIPGAYWALLSHPAATETVVKKAFRDVHMLSHLVGAANRADIRRLRQLEAEIGALTEKLARQERQLREGFAARDALIRDLKDALIAKVRHSGDAAKPGGADGEIATLRGAAADLDRKLSREIARRERLEQRLKAASAFFGKSQAALRRADEERNALARDLDLVEQHIAALLDPAEAGGRLTLSGQTLLYIGGRANQIPQLKALVERAGARFLHHDGGIEHAAALLPGLVSRADHVLFPVDCVSHDAVATIKRLCRQLDKPYRALRTASLAALMAALATMSCPAAVAAE